MVKNLPANAGDKRDTGSTTGLGRSLGGGAGQPTPVFCLENSMDRRAWQSKVLGTAKSQTSIRKSEYIRRMTRRCLRLPRAVLT